MFGLYSGQGSFAHFLAPSFFILSVSAYLLASAPAAEKLPSLYRRKPQHSQEPG